MNTISSSASTVGSGSAPTNVVGSAYTLTGIPIDACPKALAGRL
jgi:hypothetical protein